MQLQPSAVHHTSEIDPGERIRAEIDGYVLNFKCSLFAVTGCWKEGGEVDNRHIVTDQLID